MPIPSAGSLEGSRLQCQNKRSPETSSLQNQFNKIPNRHFCISKSLFPEGLLVGGELVHGTLMNLLKAKLLGPDPGPHPRSEA